MSFRRSKPVYAGALIAALALADSVKAEVPDKAPSRQEPAPELQANDAAIRRLSERIDVLERKLQGAGSAENALESDALTPESDSEAADRALEWTLIRERALLLPAKSLEAEPTLSYLYQASDTPRVVQVDGQPVVAQSIKNESLNARLDLRLGIPARMQLEISVPYVVSKQLTAITGGNGAAFSETRLTDDSGLGDIVIGASKEIAKEKRRRPALLASLLWKTTTGDTRTATGDSAILLGSGFDAVQATLTTVKTQDPLVFLAGLSYTANLEDELEGLNVDPGDVIGARLGAILAASPDTSLRFIFNLGWAEKTKIDGVDVPGSDKLSGILELGIATALSARALLNATVGVGLTDASPDITLNFSVPIRVL